MLDFDFCVVRESGGGKVTASLAGGREREREREREKANESNPEGQTQKGWFQFFVNSGGIRLHAVFSTLIVLNFKAFKLQKSRAHWPDK
jgi:hypothetical protein